MDDGKAGYDPSPVNPLPPALVVLFLAIFVVECVFAGGEAGFFGGPQAVGWRIASIQEYGFSPRILWWMFETVQFPLDQMVRFVSYPFLHFGFVHMAFAGVILLAMGKMVGEVIGPLAIPAIFFGSSIFGALIYALVLPEGVPLVGAYAGAYGLIGGFTFILWARAKMAGQSQVKAFTLIAFLMGIQLVFGVVFGTNNTWVAELAGFFSGFALCVLLVPGARRALLSKLRGEG